MKGDYRVMWLKQVGEVAESVYSRLQKHSGLLSAFSCHLNKKNPIHLRQFRII